MESVAFDRIAPRYDEVWTNSRAGRLQRDAVWRQIDPLFRAGQTILDLGCGTGEDARYLEAQGVRVHAFDASPGMTDIARYRGVDAEVRRLEELEGIAGSFDGALSNFGALNCIADTGVLRRPLARLIRPGGYFAACIIGRFCLWETLWYALRGQLGKAARRWTGHARSASLGLDVFYPMVRGMARAFAPEFTLVRVTGIGVCVPPSCASGLSAGTLTACDTIDRRVAAWRGARALADHRLLIFVRR